MKCQCLPCSPFRWQEHREPSTFANDPLFRAPSTGKTNSEAQTEQVQRRREQGEMPGHIYNLGKPTAEREAKLLAYKQYGTDVKNGKSTRKPNKHEK